MAEWLFSGGRGLVSAAARAAGAALAKSFRGTVSVQSGWGTKSNLHHPGLDRPANLDPRADEFSQHGDTTDLNRDGYIKIFPGKSWAVRVMMNVERKSRDVTGVSGVLQIGEKMACVNMKAWPVAWLLWLTEPRSVLLLAILGLCYCGMPRAHANVYATRIRLNGGVTNVPNSGTNVIISYILNEPATRG